MQPVDVGTASGFEYCLEKEGSPDGNSETPIVCEQEESSTSLFGTLLLSENARVSSGARACWLVDLGFFRPAPRSTRACVVSGRPGDVRVCKRDAPATEAAAIRVCLLRKPALLLPIHASHNKQVSTRPFCRSCAVQAGNTPTQLLSGIQSRAECVVGERTAARVRCVLATSHSTLHRSSPPSPLRLELVPERRVLHPARAHVREPLRPTPRAPASS